MVGGHPTAIIVPFVKCKSGVEESGVYKTSCFIYSISKRVSKPGILFNVTSARQTHLQTLLNMTDSLLTS